MLEAQGIYWYQQGDARLRDINLVLGAGQRLGLMATHEQPISVLLAIFAKARAPDRGTVRHALGLQLGYLPAFRLWLASRSTADSTVSLWDYARSSLATVHGLESTLHQLALEGDSVRYHSLYTRFEALGGYQAEQQLRTWLHECGLAAVPESTPVAQLASAQQQQLRLAMVLAQAPELLILETPFQTDVGSLPLNSIVRLERVLARYLQRTRAALLLHSHDRMVLQALTRQGYRLQAGKLYANRWLKDDAQKPAPAAEGDPADGGNARVLLTASSPYWRVRQGEKVAVLETTLWEHISQGIATTATLNAFCWQPAASHPPRRTMWQYLCRIASPLQVSQWLGRVGLHSQRHEPLASLSPVAYATVMLITVQLYRAEVYVLPQVSHVLDLDQRDMLARWIRQQSASVLLYDSDRQLLAACGQYWRLEPPTDIATARVMRYRQLADALSTRHGSKGVPLVAPAPTPFPSLMARIEALETTKPSADQLETLWSLYAEYYAAPALLPEYRACAQGLCFTADVDGAGGYTIHYHTETVAYLQRMQGIGHLRLDEQRQCLTTRALSACLEAACRIAFERLDCHALQMQPSRALHSPYFQSAGAGWWLASRHNYERLEGFVTNP